MFNKKNKKQMKNTAKDTQKDTRKDSKKKTITPLQLTIYYNPKTDTLDFAPSQNISLMTARGMVEEAKDDLSYINHARWNRGMAIEQKAMEKRQKKANAWSKKEKERLHKSNQ